MAGEMSVIERWLRTVAHVWGRIVGRAVARPADSGSSEPLREGAVLDVHALLAVKGRPPPELLYEHDRDKAHPRAQELMSEAFFWDFDTEDAPFGSDPGWGALGKFREWRTKNPRASLLECLEWTIRGWSPIPYDESMLDNRLVHAQLHDEEMHHEVNELDVAVISTALAQLVYEGCIDADAKPIIRLALARQRLPAVVEFDAANKLRTEYLPVISRVVERA